MLRRADGWLAAAETTSVAALLAAATLAIVADVAARALFGFAFSWTNEFTRYAIVWLTFLGAAIGARRGAHISIDVLAELLPPRVARRVAQAASLVAAAVCLVLAALSVQLVQQMARFGQTSPSMLVPMWTVYAAMPVGFGLMALHFTAHAVDFRREAARAAMAASTG